MFVISSETVKAWVKAMELLPNNSESTLLKQARELADTIDFEYFGGSKSDLSKFPHKCPLCDSPAYLGANVIECSNTSCKHGLKGV